MTTAAEDVPCSSFVADLVPLDTSLRARGLAASCHVSDEAKRSQLPEGVRSRRLRCATHRDGSTKG
jgi:hypothetical protein